MHTLHRRYIHIHEPDSRFIFPQQFPYPHSFQFQSMLNTRLSLLKLIYLQQRWMTGISGLLMPVIRCDKQTTSSTHSPFKIKYIELLCRFARVCYGNFSKEKGGEESNMAGKCWDISFHENVYSWNFQRAVIS